VMYYSWCEAPAPVIPAKYYITGDSALLGAELQWHPDAIKVMEDEYIFENLAAGDYKLKVTVNGDWSTGKGYSDLTVKAEGLSTDGDNNVIFTLAEAGDVTVVYNDSVFTVSGSFYVAPVVNPAKYYITGDSALLGAELQWHPDAIKVMEDEYIFENLAAGDYKLKVTVNGDWATGKGYSDLTVKAEGLSTDGDNNVIFTLAEAGNVTVVYNDSVFTVSGSFYVAPTPDPTAAVAGSFNEWAEPFAFALAEDKQSASFSANIAVGSYDFKMIINGEYRSNGYRYHRGFPACAGISGNESANMTFEADVQGDYIFTWFFANDSLDIIYPAKPEPVLTDGYYLVGKFGGIDAWSVIDLTAEKLFAANADAEGEYSLQYTLAEGDEIKVVSVVDDAIVTWYPAEGANYIVDANHAGETTIYFRPAGNEEWAPFGGYIYVVPTGTVDIDNTAADVKAVKVLRDGQIYIIKGDKMFNVLGTLVR